MSGKLYPPYLEEKLPAQAYSSVTGDENVLYIPFQMNRAVSPNQIDYVVARIKTVSTNNWIATLNSTLWGYDNEKQSYYAQFDLESLKKEKEIELKAGQYYKIQLAFYSAKNNPYSLGYFSSVGIFKYTTYPHLSIDGLYNNKICNHQSTYIGVYDQTGGDTTEKVYSYYFNILDEEDNLVATSGEQIHNNTRDDSNSQSSDTFYLNMTLDPEKVYKIVYGVTTLNNLKMESHAYRIQNFDIIFQKLKGSLTAINDYDTGRVLLKFYLDGEKDRLYNRDRGFIISRCDSNDNFQTWKDFKRFTVSKYSTFPEDIAEDFTVEQGVYYKYAIQQYQESGARTDKLETEEAVRADFEDMFLFDGYRQLKVRFNSKVTSFKPTILETKVDTIGGKYPFIFRNGNVGYHEFPISGLISYLADGEEMFMSDAELGFLPNDVVRYETPSKLNFSTFKIRSTQVDTDNLQAERNFKMNVLNWLTNGKPKVFRSAGEGNFIIRLMNVSCTPNETVGRMIYTFNGTAYEVAEYTPENLRSYGFVIDDAYSELSIQYHTEDLSTWKPGDVLNLSKFGTGGVFAEFNEVPPGTMFELFFMNGRGNIVITVGLTGTYTVNIYEYPLLQIKYLGTPNINGISGHLHWGYFDRVQVEDFSHIRNIYFEDQPMNYYGPVGDIIKDLTDIKYKPEYFHWIKIESRSILSIFKREDGGLYWLRTDSDFPIDKNKDLKDIYIYRVLNPGNVVYSQFVLVNAEVDGYSEGQIYFTQLVDENLVPIVWQDEQGESLPVFAEIGRITEKEFWDGINKGIPYYTLDTSIVNDSTFGFIDGKTKEYIVDSEGKNITEVEKLDYSYRMRFEDEYIYDLQAPKRIEYHDIEDLRSFSIGVGLYVEGFYQRKEYLYGVEEDNATVSAAKRIWESELNTYRDMLNGTYKDQNGNGATAEVIKYQKAKVEIAYYQFITILEPAVRLDMERYNDY